MQILRYSEVVRRKSREGCKVCVSAQIRVSEAGSFLGPCGFSSIPHPKAGSEEALRRPRLRDRKRWLAQSQAGLQACTQ